MSYHGAYWRGLIPGQVTLEEKIATPLANWAGCFAGFNQMTTNPFSKESTLLHMAIRSSSRGDSALVTDVLLEFLRNPFVARLTGGHIISADFKDNTWPVGQFTVNRGINGSNLTHKNLAHVVINPFYNADRIVTALRLSQCFYKWSNVGQVDTIPEHLRKYLPFAQAWISSNEVGTSDSVPVFTKITAGDAIQHMEESGEDWCDVYYDDWAGTMVPNGGYTVQQMIASYNQTEEELDARDRGINTCLMDGYEKDEGLNEEDIRNNLKPEDPLSITCHLTMDQIGDDYITGYTLLELAEALFAADKFK